MCKRRKLWHCLKFRICVNQWNFKVCLRIQISENLWSFTSRRVEGHYSTKMTLKYLRVLGVKTRPTEVRVNKQNVEGFLYDNETRVSGSIFYLMSRKFCPSTFIVSVPILYKYCTKCCKGSIYIFRFWSSKLIKVCLKRY